MIKPIIKLKWRPDDTKFERLEVLIGPLVAFTSACAIAAGYTNWYGLLASLFFASNLVLLVRYRTVKRAAYVLTATSLALLFVGFPEVQLYCFLLILYPLLLIYALIDTNPGIPFTAALFSSLFLVRYLGQMDDVEVYANILAILLNGSVYSLLTHMMRRLLKERNEYRHLSMIDSLTGLSSLQQTLLFGQKLIEKGSRVRVILIDLDYFKQINDSYGHMVGNKVIVHFASSLKKSVDGDNVVVGRLGGDEFVIVMEESTHGCHFLNQIEERLNHSRYVPGPGLDPLTLAFSIGEAVSIPGSTTHIEQLMHDADLNMYSFKLRNRVPLVHNQSSHLFENNPDPICTFDSKGKLLDMNPAAQEMLGYQVEDIQHLRFSDLICEENREEVVKSFYSHTVKGSPSNYEVSIIARDGTRVPIFVTNIPIIANHKVAGFYSLAINMMERKRVEDQLRQTDKVEVMARIASKFSEEIRSSIAVLSGFTKLLQDQNGQHPSLYSIMKRELERIEHISNEVTLLSDPLSAPTERHQLIELIRDSMKLLEAKALVAHVTLVITALNEIPDIVCDSSQLKHAFVHVLSNAIEAMPHGGQIQVELEQQRESVAIRIKDQGTGMDEPHLRKIGEPFYTSKRNGVGIGFMITLRIMANHKGTFLLCSETNEGTIVELKLPG